MRRKEEGRRGTRGPLFNSMEVNGGGDGDATAAERYED